MWRLVVALAYLSPLCPISPCVAVEPSTKRSPELTIEQFALKLKTEGQATQFTPVLIKVLGFPDGATKRGFDAKKDQTVDGVSRIADIVFNKADAEEPEPVGLYWTTRREAEETSKTYLYRSGLDGNLAEAVRVDAPLDERGRDVRGAGKATVLDLGDAEVRERFQREVLDFWLKGKGRKKAAPKSKPKK